MFCGTWLNDKAVSFLLLMNRQGLPRHIFLHSASTHPTSHPRPLMRIEKTQHRPDAAWWRKSEFWLQCRQSVNQRWQFQHASPSVVSKFRPTGPGRKCGLFAWYMYIATHCRWKMLFAGSILKTVTVFFFHGRVFPFFLFFFFHVLKKNKKTRFCSTKYHFYWGKAKDWKTSTFFIVVQRTKCYCCI